jgi:hypothetical protein
MEARFRGQVLPDLPRFAARVSIEQSLKQTDILEGL